MKYYLNYNLYESTYLGVNPELIVEIVIPIVSSREDDLTKMAQKYGFTIEQQILFGLMPPTIRILRKRSPLATGPQELDDNMKKYIKSLNSLSIHALRIYSAVIISDVASTVSMLRNQPYHFMGAERRIEYILSIPANSFKEAIDLQIENQLKKFDAPQVLKVHYYKNSSDTNNLYRFKVVTEINPYQLTKSIDLVRAILDSFRANSLTTTFPLEQRLMLFNKTLHI